MKAITFEEDFSMNKWTYMITTLLVAMLITTGCGGGSNNNKASTSPEATKETTTASPASGTQAITINAKNFEFDQPEIHVKQGEQVSITLNNTQGNHSIQIKGYDVEIKNGKTVTFTADKKGEFEYVCATMCGGGHGEMKGKIIVE
jgi:cytochrome c oxidase subunit II